MPFDPSSIQEEKPKTKFDPSSVRSDVPSPVSETKEEPKPEKTVKEKAKDIGISGAVGTAAGALMPELMTLGGMGAAAFPPTAPLSPFLLAGGQLLRGGRAASALAGGLSAAGGKAAGEFVPQPEKVVAEIPGAQITRRQVAETVGEFGAPGALKGAELVMRGTPVVGAAIRGLESFVGMGEQEFRKAAERQLATLRGKVPASFTEPYRRIFDSLAGAEEKERRSLLTQVENANKRAETIIDHYNKQAERVINFNSAEAQRLKKKGEDEAAALLKQTADDVERRTKTLGKAQASAAAATERGQQALASIGQPQTPTQIGTDIRASVAPIFERLKQTRAANAERLKGEAFGEALAKERAGQRVSETTAFKEALEKIKSAMVNPETKLTNVSIDEVRSQLAKVRRAIDPTEIIDGVVTGRPVSFEGLENLRRFLRDRAFGLPAEGFDAIGQRQAGELADAVEKIQREFSPKIGKFLEQYKADSKPLNDFKTKLGQAIVGTEEFDMARFATDPATLGDKFFKSETSVKDLVNLMGGNVQQVEKIARAYVADKLRGGTAKDVEKLLNSSRDWIGQFPALQQQLTDVARQMGVSEKVISKREALTKALRTDLATLPLEGQKAAGKISAEAQKESEQRVKRGLAQAQELRQTGRELAKTVEGPKVEGVLTGADPVAQIEGFITKGETEKLKKIAPALRSDPALLRDFNQALDITLSRMSPSKVSDDFERTIKPALLNTGLITPQKAADITQRLRTVQMTLEPSAAAQTARWIIRTAITGEAGMALSP
jgi:hypothetical protein